MIARYALLSVLSAPAYACPLCHTPIGEQVRAGIFNSSFLLKLVAVASPFPVFAGVIAWLYFGRGTWLR